MPEPTSTTSGARAVSIFRGTITDVHRTRYTVDVRTDTGRDYPDCQIMSSYYHVMGEGRKDLPEIGARCVVSITSDDTPPFVQGFLDLPTSVSKSEQDAEAGIESPSADAEETNVSFAGAAPEANPGDQMQFGRSGSFYFFRSSGVIQMGASAFCQRLFLPVRNKMFDFAENYTLATAGGDFSMESSRAEDSEDAEQGTRSRWIMQQKLVDPLASAMVELGDLGDSKLFRLAIAPKAIDRADGSIKGDPVFIWEVDDAGSTDIKSGPVSWEGDSFLFSSMGSMDMVSRGTHKLEALVSQETLATAKKITAPSITLVGAVSFGTGGLNPLCGNAGALQAWMASVVSVLATAGITIPPPPTVAMPNLMG